MAKDLSAEENTNTVGVNIFNNKLPDYNKETGGDWYRLYLSASMGGKSVHGCNTTPSMEVLSKSLYPDKTYKGTGILKWDKNGKKVPELGNDVSDLVHERPIYVGTVTANSTILAYDNGMWEPAQRRRAKASALLAAGIYAHGSTKSEAIRTATIIAGEEIDPEAVESAIVPASHLKREMVITTKANHRVFTRGTIQAGLIWDDQHMGLDANLTNMAFDWGRVTALARYIGEANIQNCRRFREIAESLGITYHLVRNSWAYVDEGDYHLTPEMFDKVPALDLGKLKIPSMKDSFVDHEYDVMKTVCNSGFDMQKSVETNAFKGHQQIYQASKKRRLMRTGFMNLNVADMQEVAYNSYHYEEEGIGERLMVPKIVHDAFRRAISTRIAYNTTLADIVSKFYQASDSKDEDAVMSCIDQASNLILGREVWVLARVIAEDEVRKDELLTQEEVSNKITEAVTSLSQMKSDFVKYPSHLDREVNLPASTILQVRDRVRKLILESKKYEPIRKVSQRQMIPHELRESAEILVHLNTNCKEILEKLRGDVSNHYSKLYEEGMESDNEQAKIACTRFAFLSYALNYVDSKSMCSKAAGFIDGAAPLRSYLYRCISNLSFDWEYDTIRLSRPQYPNALTIAQEIDLHYRLPFSVEVNVKYTESILVEVLGDLMQGKCYKPRANELEDLVREFYNVDSPGYDTGMMDEAEERAGVIAMLDSLQAAVEEPPLDPCEQCLNTYPHPSLADEYARCHGFRNFKEAYAKLGRDTKYDVMNPYCTTAQYFRSSLASTSGNGDSDDDHSPLI